MGRWIFETARGKIVVEVEADAAIADLQKRIDRANNLQPLMKQVSSVIRKSFDAQFKAGGDPAWRPLAASTVAFKRGVGVPSRTAKGNILRRLVQNGNFGNWAAYCGRSFCSTIWVARSCGR